METPHHPASTPTSASTPTPAPAPSLLPVVVALALAGGLGWLLSLPDRIVRGGGGPWIAAEALLLAGLLALAPATFARGWRAVAWAATLVLVLLLALADGTTRMSQGRPLDLPEDLLLLRAIVDLLQGSIGGLATGLAVAATLLLSGLVPLLLARGLRWWPRRRAVTTGGILLAAGALLALAELPRPGAGSTTGPGPDLVHRLTTAPVLRVALAQRELRRAGDSPTAGEVARALPGLAGHDVILAFIESYGVSATHDDRYAPVIRPRLASLARQAEARGFHLVSGTLEAPVVGGRSWLAHATTLAGVRIDRQEAYRELLEAEGPTLVHDFRATGHRTAALLPALIRAWPEGEALGWERIHTAAAGLDYAGPPLHWATMPDQYVWWRMEEGERRDPDPRPLFTLLAPVGSHAPWTPVLPVLDDWEGLGRGEVFQEWADAGPSPAELWRDFDRVREQYALSIEHALAVAEDWLVRYMDDHTLLLIVGDHQPTPVITGAGASPDVPVHVLSADAELLAPFLELGFVPGYLPEADPAAPPGTSPGLEAIRPALHQAFGSTPSPDPRSP